MPAIPQFGGAESLRALSQRAQRFVAEDPLRTAARDVLDDVVPDVRDEVQVGVRRLPSGGGLGELVGQTRIDGVTSLTGDGVRLRITAKPGAVKDPAAIDRGRVRHPTGWRAKTGPRVIQLVPPGWFTDSARKVAPDVRRRLSAAVRRSMQRL